MKECVRVICLEIITKKYQEREGLEGNARIEIADIDLYIMNNPPLSDARHILTFNYNFLKYT